MNIFMNPVRMKKEMIALAVLGFLIVFFVALDFAVLSADRRTIHTAGGSPVEIEAIQATNNLEKRVVLYQKLIERVGLTEAQEALFRSGLPFTGETHLLNHTSGNFAYKQYGNKGLLYCKNYFLASCYHGAILSTIALEGIEALKESMDYCWEKGIPVASQCAHGMGHGFVAWFGYKNLTKALESCDMMQKDDLRFPLFNCHDGVFMENLWGVHEDGTLSADRWINNDDPYYPCTDPRIKEEWQPGCWSNQAHVMYQMFQGSLSKVALHCDAVLNNSYKKICFDGLARQVHPIAEGNIGRALSYEICNRIIHPDAKKDCYKALFGTIQTYYRDTSERRAQCDLVREQEYRKECYATM